MDDTLKILSLLIILFPFISSSNAQNMCDESCEFSINFVEGGGSLEARDDITLVFGIGGELNTGIGGTVNTAIQPTSLDFSSGGILQLSTGESISFGQNGVLKLGTGGNIQGTNFDLNINGNVSIEAIGGNQTTHIDGDWSANGTLTANSGTLEISANVSVDGHLSLQEDTSIAGGGSIIVKPSTVLSIGNDFSLNQDAAILTQIDVSHINNSVTVTGPLSVQTLNDLSILEGHSIPTSDGNNCTVSSHECIADDGNVYVLSDGQLVKKEAPTTSSGATNLTVLALMLLLLFIRIRNFSLRSL